MDARGRESLTPSYSGPTAVERAFCRSATYGVATPGDCAALWEDRNVEADRKRGNMIAVLQAVHPVLAAHDVDESLQFYRQLGFVVAFQDAPSQPKYAVVERDGVELHLQWADATQWTYGADRPVYRFLVDDVDALFREFTVAGAARPETSQASPWARPADTPWGTREFHLRDPGGNGLQFYSPS